MSNINADSYQNYKERSDRYKFLRWNYGRNTYMPLKIWYQKQKLCCINIIFDGVI